MVNYSAVHVLIGILHLCEKSTNENVSCWTYCEKLTKPLFISWIDIFELLQTNYSSRTFLGGATPCTNSSCDDHARRDLDDCSRTITMNALLSSRNSSRIPKMCAVVRARSPKNGFVRARNSSRIPKMYAVVHAQSPKTLSCAHKTRPGFQKYAKYAPSCVHDLFQASKLSIDYRLFPASFETYFSRCRESFISNLLGAFLALTF